MKKGLLIFSIIILSFSFVIYLRQPKEPHYCKDVDKITKTFRRSVKEKYDLIPTAYGGSFMNNISVISQTYSTYDKNYDVDQTRVLFVDCVEDYLSRINQDGKIKPYLAYSPFTETGLELSIYFQKAKFEYVDSEFIAGVMLVNGKLLYIKYDHESEKFVDVHRETYEEAVRIVKEGK